MFKKLILLLSLLIEMNYALPVSNILILPKPVDGVVTAAIDEDFRLSCMTNNEIISPSALNWISPSGEVMLNDHESRIFVSVKQNKLVLQFYKLSATDAGYYTCQGVRDGVTDQYRVELVLQKKISFTGTPLTQYIQAGLDQTVVCKANSIPGPEITWFRKGVNIEIKNDDKYQMTNEGLTLKNVQAEDEGIYYCQASVTSTGEVKRAEIDVQVMHRPKFTIKPEDQDGVKDQDIVIRCEAFAKPAPVYRWYRNGIELAGPRYIITSNSLRILSLVREDTATYTCEAENQSGKEQANFRLNVLIGPIVSPMDNVHVVEGDQAVLKCVVQEAFPKAEIRWKFADTQELIVASNEFQIKDDSDSVSSSNLVGSWSELIIPRTNRVHRRNFTCEARNKAQVVERQVQLLVEFKPSFLINSEARQVYFSWISIDQFGNSGSQSSQSVRSYPVIMTCLAIGEPLPQITWYYKQVQIKHDNVKYRLIKDELGLSKMEITPKSRDDFGNYQCKAENRLGIDTKEITLRLAEAPQSPPDLKLKSTKPEVIQLEVLPSKAENADGGFQIESYRIQWRFLNSDWSTQFEKEIQIDPSELNKQELIAEISSLQPDTEYLFRIAGVNKAGLGKWIEKEFKTRTSPRRQPDPVRMISREDCQASTRCYIEWTVDSNGGSPLREFLIKWRRISYKDSTNQHVNTDKLEPWSNTVVIKSPLSNYEILNIQPNSFYEVEILAKNDIGVSASQPFRVRTLPGQIGESEAFEKRNEYLINKVILICGSVIAALILFIFIDVLLLIKFNCGLFAILTKSCKNKQIKNEFKTSRIVQQHQPVYQPINQADEPNNNVSLNA